MVIKNARELFALIAAWVLVVTFILSFDHMRSPHVIRAIVFATLAGIVILIADNWGSWNGPSSSHSTPKNDDLPRSQRGHNSSRNLLNRSHEEV